MTYLAEIFRQETALVSVEMGEGFIKIAESVSIQGKKEIASLIKRSLTSGADGIPEEIKSIFDSLNITCRRVRLNIPRHLVTVRFLKLPSIDETEISKMVRIESLKHVPYADEDMVSGYRIIEKFDDGYSNVLIAVAQADTVRREIRILNKAGFTVEAVSLGSEVLLLWYLAVSEAVEEKPAILVNIATDHIDIDVLRGNKLVFTRGVLYASSEPVPPEKIIEQINVSMTAYKKESGQPVDKVYLSGIPARAEELKPLLAGKSNISVKVIDQTRNIPVSAGARLESADASFAELIGLSLKYDDAEINLLPEATQEEQRLRAVKNNITTSVIVLALIIVIASGVVLKKLYDKRAYISYIDSELKKIEPQVKQAKKMAKEIDIVTSKIAERPLAIDLLSEVFKITPPGMTLTMMEYENRKTVTLRGQAPVLSDIFKYVTTLESSPYFENVKVKYANKRQGQGVSTADFEIVCPITKVK